MRGISLRSKVNGFLHALTVLCGIFLFCLMNVDKGGGSIDWSFGWAVGAIGGVALVVTLPQTYWLPFDH